MIHHEYHVGVADGREPVRDDEAGPVLRQRIHRLLDLFFRPCIHRGCRLIEYQKAFVRDDRSCDRQQLPLPLGDIGRILIEHHIISARKRLDEMVSFCRLCGRNHIFVCSAFSSVAYVLADSPAEQPCVLEHHGEVVAQLFSGEFPRVFAVYQYRAPVHVVESHEQLYYSGLAGARRTDYGYLLTRLDVRAEVFYYRMILFVSESHVPEFDRTLYIAHLIGRARSVGLLVFIQELKHPLGRSGHGLHLVHYLSDVLDRLSDVLHVLHEGLYIADSYGSPHALDASGDYYGCISEVADYPHQRPHETREELRLPCRFVELLVRLRELFSHASLPVEGLDYKVSREGLLDLTVYYAEVFLLGSEVLLRHFYQKPHQKRRYRKHQKRDQSHRHVDREHHHYDAGHADYGPDKVRDALRQRLPECINVVCDP